MTLRPQPAEDEIVNEFSKLAVNCTDLLSSGKGDDDIKQLADKMEWFIKNGDVTELNALLQCQDFSRINAALCRPALVIAADYGQDPIIKLLIERGANINETDRFGITPLLAAIWENHPTTVAQLLDIGADPSLLSPRGLTYVDEANDNNAVLEMMRNFFKSRSSGF